MAPYLANGDSAMPSRHELNGNATPNRSAMPIAIVGMSCRLAGAATSPDGLWQMLSRGMSGWSRGTRSRFKMDAFYHPATEISGAFNAQGLYLLKQDISQFDNRFFNISPIEAKAIDPQQRLMMEVAYEAFENAGIPIEALSASDTGVYCAVSNHDYETMLSRDPELSPSYRFTGTGGALVANRISYYFNLHGPSITLDTACSGSLVAVHEACKAIQSGQVTQALVGGTNLILDPERVSTMSSLQVLSDYGRCYTFDSRADGFGRGEGIAAIILKPLSDALRDGDAVHAVIRGSAVNSDGRTPGVTMPSQEAQVRMMRKAYAEAGLDPRQTYYVEAHGTGTKVGDKIESAAIAETFSEGRTAESALYVGSVKTNIGHAESTAGLAGLLKSILILKNGMIPSNLNFVRANDEIPLDEWHIKVPTRLQPWPAHQVRRASVNSFGYGGTNAHVILEAPEDYLASSLSTPSQSHTNGRALNGSSIKGWNINGTVNGHATNGHSSHGRAVNGIDQNGISNGDVAELKANGSSREQRRLFVFSHENERGMSRLATDFHQYLQQSASSDSHFLDSLAYTLSARRSRLGFRVALGATNIDELLAGLDNVAKGSIRPQRAAESPKIGFAFTGQGAQWAHMGLELLDVYPVFAESMAISDLLFQRWGAGWSLLTELTKSGSESRINEAALSQPCCTAIQIALVDLLRSWHVHPHVVCGHSSGEIAAAYAAGFLSAADALGIAFHRGQAVGILKKRHPTLEGRMLAAGLSAEQAQDYIANGTSKSPTAGNVVVACINSPSSVTLSGDHAAIKLVQADLERDGIFNRLLVVDVAYHSHHMEIVRQDYLYALAGLEPRQSDGRVRMISSVTGKEIQGKAMNADYWARNMVSPVRFAEALEGTLALSSTVKSRSRPAIDLILEVGPHSALAGPIKQTLKASALDTSDLSYHSVLMRKMDATKSTIETAGELFTRGVDIRFDAINDPVRTAEKKVLTNLPLYSWQHTASHWSEGRVSTQYRHRHFARHDLLGVPSNDSLSVEPTWRNYLRLSELPWLKGHVVNDQVIFPAAGHICMALEALRQNTMISGRMWKNVICHFRQVVVGRALLIPDDATGVETFLTLHKSTYSARELSPSWMEFRVFSMSNKGEASEHCRGLVSVDHRTAADDVEGQRKNELPTAIARQSFEDAKSACRSSMDPERLYSDLSAVGIGYTDPFANFTEIYARPNQSFCRIAIPNTKRHMPAEYQQPHVIHPATLDTCFQTSFPAMMKAAPMTSSVVLSTIEEMEISSEISSEPGAILVAHNTVERFGRSKQRADVLVGDANLADPSLIRIRGLGFTSTDAPSIRSSRTEGVNLCHRVEWSLDTACATPEQIYQLCRQGLTEASAREQRETYDLYIQTIIHKVLSALTPKDEETMAPHHRNLVNWMRQRAPSSPVSADSDLRQRVESFGIDGLAVAHVGDHLLEILQGQVDPLTILMQDDLLYRVYSTENTHRCHHQLANYVRLLQFKNPHLRILEIGAGTASTTVPILEALSSGPNARPAWGSAKLDQYVFTDISSGFFEKARERLERWSDLVEFKKFDVEKPVAEQGFEEGTFDLIIASNVLHATASMSNTLNNVRSLLKPGAALALVEITEPHMVWPMIVGSLPGWWLGAPDGRVNSPLLTWPRWEQVLQQTGFSGVELGMKDYEPEFEHQISLIISKAIGKSNDQNPSTIHIVSNEGEREIAEAFSHLLKEANDQTQVQQSSLDSAEPAQGICVVFLEVIAPFLATCSEAEFEKVKTLFSQASGLLWVTRGASVESSEPEKALITGLTRTLRSEDQTLNVFTLDLDPSGRDDASEMATQIYNVFSRAFQPDGADGYLKEFEYAVRNGQTLVPRLVEDAAVETFVECSMDEQQPQTELVNQPDRALGLEIETPGLLETLYWTDNAAHNSPPGPNQVRVEMKVVALNFKDLMNAMGQLEGLTAMLIESSGSVVAVGENARDRFSVGDRVCAIGPDGLATTSNLDQHLVQRIPDDMSFELAAAVQISYATALYALRDVGRLQAGESVLIHSAAGALGQAAIALARHLGAGDIYVTVGNAEKKTLIMEHWGIPEEHIFSSRSLSFGSGIRQKTNGRGVDVVLNSLSGEAARETQQCLAPFGRFVELGKKDLLTNARMEMQYLERSASFAAVDLTMVAEHKPAAMQDLLETALCLIHTGQIPVLQPMTVKPITELEDAFRLMQAGKHVGKLLLRIEPDSQALVRPPQPTLAQLDAEATYLVVGGLGGLGRAIIRYLAQLGAKHIATLSRSGADATSKQAFVQEMRDTGVDLVMVQGSVVECDDIRKVRELAGGRPIRGVIQGAMVLQDSIVSNMTYAQWRTSLGPKLTGTLNLDTVLGDSVDFFILLSSGCGIVGSHGQGNYSAGSTFQDAFARNRASQRKLPVRSIDLGVIGSEGYTAENAAAAEHALRQGVTPVRLEELFALINHAITHPLDQSSDPKAAQVLVGHQRADPESGTEEAAAQRADPRFSHIWIPRSRLSGTSGASNARAGAGGDGDVRTTLRAATAPHQAIEAVQTALVRKLARLLAMPVEGESEGGETISPERTVSSYGTDSLMAVELRNWVSKQLEAHVQIFELMSTLSIRELSSLIAERSRLVPAALFHSAAATAAGVGSGNTSASGNVNGAQ